MCTMLATPRPVMLVILDGWGWREDPADNAVRQAKTPVFDRLWRNCPHAFLRTSGLDVGLPDGQMGNSEVGHLNIGAGRVVMQDLPRIGAALADGSFARLPALQEFIAKLRASGDTCHLVGLVSPGGVHAHQDHAVALARAVTAAGVPALMHAFLDGRDTPPRSGGEDIRRLRQQLPDSVRIATVSGRYYAMDRDRRWDRVARAYLAMAEGQGQDFADAASAVDAAYGSGVTDEFVVPSTIAGYSGMADGDALLCFNFRADRIREICTALLDPDFTGFDRPRRIAFAAAAGMTRYSDALAPYMTALFAPQTMENLLGQVVAAAGRTQLRLAETEKYPHVTYFLNGGVEDPNPGEDRIMKPSPKVATYDLQPEMSAPGLTDKAIASIDKGSYDLIVLNFANADMVGHTGSLPAAIKAVEAVDACLGRIVDAMDRQGGVLLVTADHGNAELMRDPETGAPHTAHTTNKVPVLLAGDGNVTLHDGRLADIAPTLLHLMGLPQPAEMTGRNLMVAPA
ncbi:MAG TPA: 2,3-bisphosphoglycerate-independent phosphoglycerate mutase [Acetobacteraceae bacterium]